MTRKYYNKIASIIIKMPVDDDVKMKMTYFFAEELKNEYSNFNKEKFIDFIFKKLK